MKIIIIIVSCLQNNDIIILLISYCFFLSFPHLFMFLISFHNFNFINFNGNLGQKSPLRVNWPNYPLLVWSVLPIILNCFLNPDLIIWTCSQFFSMVFTFSLTSQLSLGLGCHRVPFENRAATDLAVTSRFGHTSLWPQLI